MPDSLDSSADTDDLPAIHARVICDDDLDHRYRQPISNATKVEAICHATGLTVETFDLTEAYPLEDWAASDDTGILICGSFVTDLQEQFYRLVINDDAKTAPHKLWEAHAEAEYWNGIFERTLSRRNGAIVKDKRKLN